MPFYSPSRKKESEGLDTVEESKRSHEIVKRTGIDGEREDSIAIPSPVEPLPTRNPSTRIHEPARKPSQMNRSTSNLYSSSTSKSTSRRPERPVLHRSNTTADTSYIRMLLALDDVPMWHNILASFFTYILLAGYIVFPATFKKFQSDQDLDDEANSELKKHALNSARNIPLLYIAAFSCGIGVIGCMWLYWMHRRNYVWVIQRIFLPALMNSIAGLISTFVNVYSAQDGQYSATAQSTIIVTSAFTVLNSALFLFYNFWKLWHIKRKHRRETKAVRRSQSMMERGEGRVKA